MSITVAGSGTFDSSNPGTSNLYTAAAGSNRLLVIFIAAEDGTGDMSPEFGGVPFVDASSDPAAGASGTDGYIGYILEANIPSGSNQITLGGTYSGSSWTTEWGGSIYTLAGCAQTGQPNPAVDEQTQITSATSHTTNSVTSVTDGILIASFAVATAGGHDAGATITGYTEIDVTDMGGGSWISGYKLISSGGSESATFDWNSQSQTGLSMLLGFAPHTGGNVYINDAPTLDGGEVMQAYPGTTNWSATSITVPTAPDITGLSGQLYLIVERADGVIGYREIEVGAGVVDTAILIPTGPWR